MARINPAAYSAVLAVLFMAAIGSLCGQLAAKAYGGIQVNIAHAKTVQVQRETSTVIAAESTIRATIPDAVQREELAATQAAIPATMILPLHESPSPVTMAVVIPVTYAPTPTTEAQADPDTATPKPPPSITPLALFIEFAKPEPTVGTPAPTPTTAPTPSVTPWVVTLAPTPVIEATATLPSATPTPIAVEPSRPPEPTITPIPLVIDALPTATAGPLDSPLPTPTREATPTP